MFMCCLYTDLANSDVLVMDKEAFIIHEFNFQYDMRMLSVAEILYDIVNWYKKIYD